MRPIGEAVVDEVVELAEVAVVGACTHVDKHYTYTAKIAEDDYSDDDSDGSDTGINDDNGN